MPIRSLHIASVLALMACGPRPSTPATAPAATSADQGAIAGVVRDSGSGEPLSLARIEVIEWSTKERAQADVSTDAHGRYRVGPLPPGTYMIDVSYADHRTRFFAVPVEPGATTALDVKIDTMTASSDRSYDYVDIAANPVLANPPVPDERHAISARRVGGIRGTVRDALHKQELAGAVVAATTPGLRDAQLAIADDDGVYALRSLPPGTYTLSVYYHLVDRGNIEIRRTGVEVVAGEITVIDLSLDAKTDD